MNNQNTESGYKRSEYYLNKVQQIAKIGFWELDLCTGENWWSDEVYKIFQLDPTLGPPTAEVYLSKIHPEDQKKLLVAREKAIQENSGYVMQLRIIRTDMTIAYVVNHAKIEFNDETLEKKMFGVLQDITSTVERENSSSNNKVRIFSENNLTLMSEMVRGIAHEMNNPLAIIVGKINFLQSKINKKYPDDREILNDLASIEKSSLRVAKIISALKVISDSKGQDVLTEVDLDNVVDMIMSVSGEKISSESVKFDINKTPGLKVLGNASELSLAILALLYNAHDFVVATESPWISLEIIQSDELEIKIIVTDSGTGISSEISDKIMNPFFTTKPIGKGIGLGLSISQSIIKKLNGVLELDRSYPNTRFVIRLPAYGENQLIPLSIEDAINAHLEWKQNLISYSMRPDGSLKTEDTCRDDFCSLGRWIYHPKNKFKDEKLFRLLKEKHHMFHVSTAEFIQKINNGDAVTKDLLSEAENSYTSLSIEVVRLLNDLHLNKKS